MDNEKKENDTNAPLRGEEEEENTTKRSSITSAEVAGVVVRKAYEQVRVNGATNEDHKGGKVEEEDGPVQF